jgi:cystathionine beta-lyase
VSFTERVDRITIDALRATGATKWANEDGTVGAFIAEMDFGIAPAITQALHAAVEEGAFGYLPARLTADLRGATSEMMAHHHGWTIGEGDVWPVPDVIKALEMAIQHSRPGAKVIVPTPAYMPFLLIPPHMGREVIEVPMVEADGRYTLDLERLDAAFAAGGNLLILCNPCNPVGRVFAREELEAISEVVDRHGGRVFSDEIWAPLVHAGHRHVPYASVNAAAAGHTLTAISASKAWNLPGLKCAQVIVSNEADRALWRNIGFFAGHGTSNLGVVANVAAYRSGFEWLGEALGYLGRNRLALARLVAEKLPGVVYRPPEGTYIGWLDFRGALRGEGLSDRPAAFFKERAGVQLTDGENCGEGFGAFARLVFATPLPVLEDIMERLAAALSKA